MDDYVGEDIHYFDKYNPLVRKENKLMQSAIEDARKVYLLHEAGIEKETSSSDSFLGFGFYANYLQLSIKQLLKKIRKGVPYESHYKICREFYETLPIRWRNLY